MGETKLSEGEIQRLLTQYIREKNREAVSALKMVKTRVATEKGRLTNVEELEEGELLKIVKKEVKEIQDTIDSLRKAGRKEQIQEEEKKKRSLEELLPASITQEEIQKIVSEAVQELGGENFGKIMKAVMQRVAGRADGKLVSDVVRKAISSDK